MNRKRKLPSKKVIRDYWTPQYNYCDIETKPTRLEKKHKYQPQKTLFSISCGSPTLEYLDQLNSMDFCFACGLITRTERCHIDAISDGGSDDVTNLHLLCKSCHFESELFQKFSYWSWFNSKNEAQALSFWLTTHRQLSREIKYYLLKEYDNSRLTNSFIRRQTTKILRNPADFNGITTTFKKAERISESAAKFDMKALVVLFKRRRNSSDMNIEGQRKMIRTLLHPENILEEVRVDYPRSNHHPSPVLELVMKSARKNKTTLLFTGYHFLPRSVDLVTEINRKYPLVESAMYSDLDKIEITILQIISEFQVGEDKSRPKQAAKRMKNLIKRDGYYISKAGNKITKLGGCANPNTAPARKAWKEKSLSNRNKNIARPFARELRRQGMSYHGIAMKLNEEGYTTSTGKFYYKTSVQRLLED